MLEWRLGAYRRWLTLEEPTWARVHYPKIDFQDIYYYAAPKSQSGPKSLDEVDPEILKVYEKARHSAERAGNPGRRAEELAAEGDEASTISTSPAASRSTPCFDSVSVVTTFKEELKKAGVLFMSISEAIREYPRS
jgi:Fe-S cluster assembly protein SufB